MALVSASMAMSGDGDIAGSPDAEQALSSGGATSVGYTIERERIPEAIADLRRALMALEQAADEALRHQHIVAPGGDPYSARAVTTMGSELVANYVSSNARDRESIESMIENLEAAMRRYDAQEDRSTRSFRPES
ncbi:hypothetical protein [Haloactinomyces albus]|uniref:Uncharacterized protein n=1 Tax=Haloactinomyces albus TaxID=1352928 RepID=A0AAE3ZFM8_9ACTN|nr:hypothetical protein [Haloactinomyces albus]MDR7302674.1 hypothetical protein [Haloactinomyces albus]